MNPDPAREPVVEALAQLGEPASREHLDYVGRFGLTDSDIPALVELARRWADDAHFEATGGSDAMWAPIHAWRALSDLNAEALVPTLLDMLDTLDDAEDDWFFEETPRLFARIGAPAVEPLVAFVSDDGHAEYARVAAAEGLEKIAASDAACREPVERALVDVLGRCSRDHPSLNGFLVSYLLELRAVEHADLIKRVYDEGVVDEMVCGAWPWVAFELGIGPRPPSRPSPFERVRRSNSRPSTARPQPAQQRQAKKVDKKSEKAARKRQKHARKKNRRR